VNRMRTTAIGTLTLAALMLALTSPIRAQVETLPPLSTIEPLGEPGPTGTPADAFSTGYGPQGPSPPGEYFDLDAYVASNCGPTAPSEDWCWQILPSGLVYQGYLADPKESRLGTQFFSEGDRNLWDTNLGGHVGILRLGTVDAMWAQGWQLDLEGSGQVRLATQEDRNLESSDFRVGVPLTFGYGHHRLKFGYYHISAHMGDEFLERNPGTDRVNFVRDVLVLGYAYYWTDNLRLYAETGWAFYADVSQPWEFRFGAEYAPARPTGLRGAPFAAVHTNLRQELDFGGYFVVQAGWAWRGDRTSHLFRTGLHYHNGTSNQYSFYDQFEQQIGAGVWYDF
jgi:hypothetical protein